MKAYTLTKNLRVTEHAVDQYRQRHGENYLNHKKVKNMDKGKLKSKIYQSLREEGIQIIKQGDNTLLVKTEDIEVVVKTVASPEYDNVALTVI